MSTLSRAYTGGALAAVALGLSFAACAQDAMSGSIAGASSPSGKSFIGLAVGKPTYGTSCGSVAGLTCANNGTSYSLTAGNMITQNVGVELSYLDFGRADRAGGSVSARGLNLAAVGRLPLGQSFALEGKVGATYGITHVNAAAVSGLSSGRDSGVGLGYGVALDVAVARGVHGSLGWEQHDFHFAGQGTSNVRNITVGLAYRF